MGYPRHALPLRVQLIRKNGFGPRETVSLGPNPFFLMSCTLNGGLESIQVAMKFLETPRDSKDFKDSKYDKYPRLLLN